MYFAFRRVFYFLFFYFSIAYTLSGLTLPQINFINEFLVRISYLIDQNCLVMTSEWCVTLLYGKIESSFIMTWWDDKLILTSPLTMKQQIRTPCGKPIRYAWKPPHKFLEKFSKNLNGTTGGTYTRTFSVLSWGRDYNPPTGSSKGRRGSWKKVMLGRNGIKIA